MNVKDANGWRPVDTGLVGAQGRVTAKAQPLSPSLADRANDPAAMSVQVDGKRAALTLDHAAASPAKVTGSRATYENVLADTDLTYDITAGSVKETIVLRKPGVSSWRFRLSTSGLTPRLEKFGGVSLVDDAGTVKMAIPPV